MVSWAENCFRERPLKSWAVFHYLHSVSMLAISLLEHLRKSISRTLQFVFSKLEGPEWKQFPTRKLFTTLQFILLISKIPVGTTTELVGCSSLLFMYKFCAEMLPYGCNGGVAGVFGELSIVTHGPKIQLLSKFFLSYLSLII